MGVNLLWTGLTLVEAGDLLPVPAVQIVGKVLMIIGVILLWIGR